MCPYCNYISGKTPIFYFLECRNLAQIRFWCFLLHVAQTSLYRMESSSSISFFFLCVCVCYESFWNFHPPFPSFSSVICVWNGSRAQLVPGRGRKNFRSASFGPFVFYFSIIYCCRTAVSSTNVLPLHHNSCYSAGDLLFPSNFHRLIIIPQ